MESKSSKDLIKVDEYAAIKLPPEELNEIVEQNLAGEAIGEFDLDRIKMPSGGGQSWAVPTLTGEDSTKELTGVIVFWKDTRSYWAEAYSGGNEPPQCSAPDAQHATGDPGQPVPTDSNGKFLCEQCPNSRFGSAEDGRSQACKLSRILFLLTPDQLLPLVVALPPTSVGGAKKFFLRLASSGVSYRSVVTTIGLEKAKSGGGIDYSQANFSVAGRLEGDQAERVREYADKLRPAFERAQAQRDETGVNGGNGEGVAV